MFWYGVEWFVAMHSQAPLASSCAKAKIVLWSDYTFFAAMKSPSNSEMQAVIKLLCEQTWKQLKINCEICAVYRQNKKEKIYSISK